LIGFELLFLAFEKVQEGLILEMNLPKRSLKIAESLKYFFNNLIEIDDIC